MTTSTHKPELLTKTYDYSHLASRRVYQRISDIHDDPKAWLEYYNFERSVRDIACVVGSSLRSSAPTEPLLTAKDAASLTSTRQPVLPELFMRHRG